MTDSTATESQHPSGAVNLETIRLIIARLIVRYGSGSWNAKYREVAEDVLLKDWLHALGHFTPTALDYGLENLPADFLPNASQFRLICQRAPARPDRTPKLDAPKPDPDRLKAAFARMGQIAKGRSPTAWIDDLDERIRRGEHLPIATKKMLADAKLALFGSSRQEREIAEAEAKATAQRVEAYMRAHPETRA